MYAQDTQGDVVEARPGLQAICPHCGGVVRPICGDKNIWHFRHEHPCPYLENKEPESELHRAWKRRFSKDQNCHIEYKIGKGIADIAYIKDHTKIAIEIQKSTISGRDVINRSFNYLDNGFAVAWIFELRDVINNFNVKMAPNQDLHKTLKKYVEKVYNFNWGHARKYIGEAIAMRELGHKVQCYVVMTPGEVMDIQNVNLTQRLSPKFGEGNVILSKNILQHIVYSSTRDLRDDVLLYSHYLLRIQNILEDIKREEENLRSARISLDRKLNVLRGMECGDLPESSEKIAENLLNLQRDYKFLEKIYEEKDRSENEWKMKLMRIRDELRNRGLDGWIVNEQINDYRIK